VTLAFRQNRAQVRYWVWLSASVKFLVPFALLMNLGNSLWTAFAAKKIAAELAPPAVSLTVQQIAQPFPQTSPFAPAASPTHTADWILVAIFSVWLCGFLGVALARFRSWLRIRAAVRASTPIDIQATVAVRSSPGLLEPGVVGLLRPVVLFPEGILKRLPPSQLDAVIAHELSHIKRRDNLTAAIHMVVEAVFWFHPLVWWIGARLVEERERACDEAVLSLGGEPRDYADAIVSVCKLYVESPLACVSGISGADLKRRIVRIMARHVGLNMSLGKKLLLLAVALVAVAMPIAIGLASPPKASTQLATAIKALLPKPTPINLDPSPINGPQITLIPKATLPAPRITMAEPAAIPSQPQNTAATSPRYEYEAATIKPSKGPGPDHKIGLWAAPDGFRAWFITPQQIISVAYGVESFRISGGPDWVPSERFDIEAKMDAATADALEKLSRDQRVLAQQQMLQALLGDRFRLTVHRETKELTTYTLVIAKGGPKLQEAKPGDTYPNGGTLPDGTHAGAGDMKGSQTSGDLRGQAVPVARLVQSLTLMLGRPVSDKTELKGVYDFKLQFTPDDRLQPPSGLAPNARLPVPPADSNAPSLFDALQEQLGLKLESGKGPAEVIVIDHVERPSAN
jgi:uncharacterized protein (TIGR03435 family)